MIDVDLSLLPGARGSPTGRGCASTPGAPRCSPASVSSAATPWIRGRAASPSSARGPGRRGPRRPPRAALLLARRDDRRGGGRRPAPAAAAAPTGPRSSAFGTPGRCSTRPRRWWPRPEPPGWRRRVSPPVSPCPSRSSPRSSPAVPEPRLPRPSRSCSWPATVLERLGESAVAVLEAFHRAKPLQAGMPREELRARAFAGAPPAAFERVLADLAAAGRVRLAADAVASAATRGAPHGR
jgi:hypothetical protein